MQSSVRAVEGYRRCRLIDGVTADEDKVAPVYRLEEICQILRSSPSDVSREMLEHTMKRLEHKSPIVKQKTLRFLKYAATKGGPDFKRDMHRQAGVIRALFHYKGQLDALKGDALNKAVRDTAHETIAAIFGSEDKGTIMEDVGKRIQGFGSTNYEKPREEEKKSVFSGLVGFGSQSFKQSMDMINNHYSGSGSGGTKNPLSGTFRSHGLRRSLTSERERLEKEGSESWNLRDDDTNDERHGPSPKISPFSKAELSNGKGTHSDARGLSSIEDRLLDSLTTPGGIRLQPTRETLQTFTTAAQKLDAANLVNSIETKLKAHNWQVRFKALCLLEALIRERENKVLDSVTVMFEEDANAVVECLSSPQASLREKAKKVLGILGASGKDIYAERSVSDRSSVVSKPPVTDIPDLMDTRDLDFNFDGESLQNTSVAANVEETATPINNVAPGVLQDLFGDWVDEPAVKATVPVKESESDPFAGMSFHSADDAVRKRSDPDLFSGLDVDTNTKVGNGTTESSSINDNGSLFDGLSMSQSDNIGISQDNVVDLFASLSTSNGTTSGSHNVLEQLHNLTPTNHHMKESMSAAPTDLNQTKLFSTQQVGSGGQGGILQGTNLPSQMFPPGAPIGNGLPAMLSGQFSSNVMLQQSLGTGPMNFTGVAGPFAQQHFTPSFPAVARYGQNLQTNTNGNVGGFNQNFSDGFDFSSDPVPRYSTSTENTKTEDTKAFDFILDHVSSQLGPKKNR